jgi:hypothetical protein
MDIAGKPDNPVKSSTINDMAHSKVSKKYLHIHTKLRYPY